MSLTSDQLMRQLIPDGKIKDVCQVSGLKESLIYQERRPFGDNLTDTGTRNTIARLDIFTDLALSWNPNAVRMLGERYLDKYNNALDVSCNSEEITVEKLLNTLALVGKECGEAMAAIGSRRSIHECTVEVTQAKEILEKALKMVEKLERQ